MTDLDPPAATTEPRNNRIDDSNQSVTSKTVSWKSIAKKIIWLLVIAGVGWAIWNGYQDLKSQGDIRWTEFRWHWLLIAMMLYFAGMAPSWLYWHWLLRQFHFSTTAYDTFAAFYLSQLGKYVPGKVMVVLIRTSILCHRPIDSTKVPPSPDKLNESPAIQQDHQWIVVSATALMETLTFIAVGGMIGVLSGSYFFANQIWVLALAFAIAVALPLPILPPIFRIWIRKIPLLKNREAIELLCRQWTWKTLMIGSIILPFGWLGLGGCLWALFNSLPDVAVGTEDYPAALTCVSLANVLGFVSLIPGGFGVREVVMYPILEPRFSLAIVIVILYRLTSLAAELAAGGLAWLLTLFVKPSKQSVN